ncbi:GntR family transcriptional regulator [Caulobacter sp. RL271]|uniref:GntR family transcriptional regulator n=1 Tax=Caulobacter segnis TaxID=88688 RepID=A0ABY4ZRI3_9CAUL|nr:GntR family transcriptional regulator [Caulobacter segnis]USQ95300.1 GntR family transcriptional regulator [Caulobacter segnis]
MTRLPTSGEAGGKSAAAYVRLKELAVRGELRPALQLRPADIARRFGFSDTPIREALARLYAEGFVEWRRSQGYYSKVFTEPEQRELLEVCQDFLVASIAGLPSRPEAMIPRPLTDMSPTVLERDDSAEFIAAQVEGLYIGLAEAAGNATRLDMVRQMMERTHLVRVLDLRAVTVARATIDVVVAMGEALLTRDLDAAERAGRQAVRSRLDRLSHLVGEANAQAATSTFPDDGFGRPWRTARL